MNERSGDWNALSLPELWQRLCALSPTEPLIDRALAEDLGEAGDITSVACIEPHRYGEALLRARATTTLAGLRLVGLVAKRLDPVIDVAFEKRDGDCVGRDEVVARLYGPMRSILATERTLLNFVSHLSGIATLTARFVEAVEGTAAAIHDTRKTLPGYRMLAKYAVRCGGGRLHRLGLHDAVLIKDNHIAHVTSDDLGPRVGEAIERARSSGAAPSFVEVEVDGLDQLDAVLAARPDVVLLDNMSVESMGEAVCRRDERAPGVMLEASGGVNLEAVRRIAESGVDRIAIGALTHSAPAADLGLDIDPV